MSKLSANQELIDKIQSLNKLIANYNLQDSITSLESAIEQQLQALTDTEIAEFNNNIAHYCVMGYGSDLILFACKKGLINVLRKLLEKGFTPIGRDELGQTPMHYAAIYRNQQMYDLLKQYGAPDNIPDIYGNYPEDYNQMTFSATENPTRKRLAVPDRFYVLAPYTSNPCLSNLWWFYPAFFNQYLQQNDDLLQILLVIANKTLQDIDNDKEEGLQRLIRALNDDRIRLQSLFDNLMKFFCERRNKVQPIKLNVQQEKIKPEIEVNAVSETFSDIGETFSYYLLARIIEIRNIKLDTLKNHIDTNKAIGITCYKGAAQNYFKKVIEKLQQQGFIDNFNCNLQMLSQANKNKLFSLLFEVYDAKTLFGNNLFVFYSGPNGLTLEASTNLNDIDLQNLNKIELNPVKANEIKEVLDTLKPQRSQHIIPNNPKKHFFSSLFEQTFFGAEILSLVIIFGVSYYFAKLGIAFAATSVTYLVLSSINQGYLRYYYETQQEIGGNKAVAALVDTFTLSIPEIVRAKEWTEKQKSNAINYLSLN